RTPELLGYLLDPTNPPPGRRVPKDMQEINQGFTELPLKEVPSLLIKESVASFRNLKITPLSP
ncbi:MAG: hypothetical protein NZ700_03155, partial [Gemmataceae bacterium]|nr:hypothetical protein [Gemmataceae bacterium]